MIFTKPKDSRCMNRLRYISALCLLSCGLVVSAQTYENVLRNNFWNASDNVAGIRQDTVSVSVAELSARYESGGFRDPSQAPEGWSAGASTSSIRHLEKVSLAGSFSFEQTEGYGMCGSMFITPGSYPVDIFEFTPGRKTLQTYAFEGGISYDIAPEWRIGAKMDFESANLAKRKDLRHVNWKLDMTVSPGFMYHSGDFAVGASALFRKVSESVDPTQVGTAESSYYAFLDKGMMYGTYSVWTGSGLHLDESGVNGFPVKDLSYGAAMQVEYRNVFTQIRYLRSSGIVGEKEYIWFRYPGNEVAADMGWRISESAHGKHTLRIGTWWKGITMDESVLEKVTENGVTTVTDHGSNRILSRSQWHISPEYELLHPLLEVRAGADIDMTGSISSQVYPYVYSQSLFEASAYVDIEYHLGRFDWGCAGRYGGGKVSEKEDLVSGNSGVQTVPFRLQEWYDMQLEYRTARRFHADIMVRYNFEGNIYLEADMTSVKAFGLKYLTGPDRFSAVLRLGYRF